MQQNAPDLIIKLVNRNVCDNLTAAYVRNLPRVELGEGTYVAHLQVVPDAYSYYIRYSESLKLKMV